MMEEDKMPPSGLSQKAVNGLLEFVKVTYQDAKAKHSGTSLTEEDFLKDLVKRLESCPQNISQEGMKGLAIFLAECYKDLSKEIVVGKDKYGRPVINGKAIDKEIGQIGNYLLEFTI